MFRTNLLVASLLALMISALVAPAMAGAVRGRPLPKPDLKISEISASKSPQVEQKYSFSFRVRKSPMQSKPAGATTARVWLSNDKVVNRGDVVVGNPPVKSLVIYGSRSSGLTIKSWPASHGAGVRYIIVCADFGKKVAESNERNNCLWKQVTVKAAIPYKPTVNVAATRPGVEGSAAAPGFVEVDISLDKVTTQDTPVQVFSQIHTPLPNYATGEDIVATLELIIPAGQTLGTARLPIIGDSITEEDQQFLAAVTPRDTSWGILGPQYSLPATIIDDDAAGVTAAGTAGTKQVRLTLTGPPTNVAGNGSQFTIAGYTVSGAAVSKSVITLTVTANLMPATTYTVNLNGVLIGTRAVPATAGFTT